MKFKDRDPATFEVYRSRLRSMMGVAGINGLLEVLVDITQDFGDGSMFANPDAFWLNAAAQIDDCKEKIEVEL